MKVGLRKQHAERVVRTVWWEKINYDPVNSFLQTGSKVERENEENRGKKIERT